MESAKIAQNTSITCIQFLIGVETLLHSINHPKQTDTRLPNTLNNTGVMEEETELATEEEGGPFGIRVALASLQQTGNLNKEAAEIPYRLQEEEHELSSSEIC